MADITLTPEIVQKLKVADLKKELKDRGLAASGTKAELSERLLKSMSDANSSADQDLSLGEENISLVDHEEELLKEKKAEVEEEVQEPPTKKIALVDPVKVPLKPVTSPTEENKISFPQVSEAERLKKRTERFGAQSDKTKLQMRAERFGTGGDNSGDNSTPAKNAKLANTPVTAGDLDKLKKRAERFGSTVSTALSKLEEEERVKKRKERFGAITSGTLTTKTTNTVAVSDTEEKKKKRMERFGLS